MDKIFISYRREDTEGFARSLFQSLAGRFGKDRVFMDVEAIGLGMDFVEAIDSSLADCGALLVLIGKEWATCTDGAGRLRLDKTDDFVRIEIARALERNVRVIPVMVKGAQMPKAKNLPEELRSLTRRQALELRHEGWDHDVEHLATSLEKAIGLKRIDTPKPSDVQHVVQPPSPPAARPRRSKAFGIGAAAVGILVLLVVLIYQTTIEPIDPVYEKVESTLPVAQTSPSAPAPTVPSTPAPAVVPSKPAPSPVPAPKPVMRTNLTGVWIDDDGARVEIVQTGATAVSQAIDPASGVLIQANWQLSGRAFEFNWAAASGNQGYGRGSISADYNTMRYEAIDYATGEQIAGRLIRSGR